MKKISLVLVSVLLSLALMTSAFAADYGCSLAVSDTSVAAGDIIKIDFNISEGLSGIDVIISFDSAKLEFIEGAATDLMTVFSNEAQSGSVHLAAVSTQATRAGTLYSFKLRVLASDAVISTHVKEALDGNDNDVSALIADNTVTVKATGNYHSVQQISGPLPTTSPIIGADQADTAQPADGNGSASAVQTPESNTALNGGEEVSEAAEGGTDTDGTTAVTLTRDDQQSRIGLIVAVAVGIIALCAVAAVIIVKKKSSSESGDHDADKTE